MFILIVYLILAVFGCFEGVAGSARIFFWNFGNFFFARLVNKKEEERGRTTASTHECQQQRDGQQVGNELSSFNNGGSLLNLNDCKEAI